MLWIFGECKRNSRGVLLKCAETDSRNESNLPKQRFPLLSMEWHVDKNIVWYVVRIRLGVLYDTVEKKLCVPICFIQSDFDLAVKTNGFRNFFLSIPTVHLAPFNSRSKLLFRQTAVSEGEKSRYRKHTVLHWPLGSHWRLVLAEIKTNRDKGQFSLDLAAVPEFLSPLPPFFPFYFTLETENFSRTRFLSTTRRWRVNGGELRAWGNVNLHSW